MSFEIEELIISENNTIDQVIEYIKILLNKSEKIRLIANTKCSVISAKASEKLVRLGYVKYDNIQTKTDIEECRRNTKLIITLKKTNKLKNLYKENKENIKNNIITGEIEIKDFLEGKLINIEKIDKKMNEFCEIYINNIKIDFTFKYNFLQNGINKIYIKCKNDLTHMNNMFSYCSSLKSLNLYNFNTNNFIDMSSMFFNCSSLTFLDLSHFNTNNVTNMKNMFYNCYSLTSLNLSNFNTNNVTDMNNMFYNCSSLISLDLSNFNTNNVNNMSEMFSSCSSLTSLNTKNERILKEWKNK